MSICVICGHNSFFAVFFTACLRARYRTLELPGKSQLEDAHATLDAAVLDAYGFSPKRDLLAQLLELNLAVAQRKKGESRRLLRPNPL